MPRPGLPHFDPRLLVHSFFSHPKRVAGSVWFASMFSLLIPTIVKLDPLGRESRDAKGERDEARDKVDESQAQLVSLNAQITEANQRVVDLFCAMDGYQKFNDGVIAFKNSLDNSTATPAAKLGLFWNVHFASDRTEPEQYVRQRSYTEDEWEYDYYYSCLWHDCGDKSCCYDWGWHWVTYTRYYDEITRIVNDFKNIAQGPGLELPTLACGYYSRATQYLVPETYLVRQSPPVESGRRSSGTTYIDYQKFYGSRTSIFYELDGAVVNQQLVIPRDTDRTNAQNSLAAALYNFLGLSIAAFNSVGSSYPQIQQRINNTIPLLTDSAHQVAHELADRQMVLRDAQARYDRADDDFQEGLSLWLPLFFIVPMGLAFLTYVLLLRNQARCLALVDDKADNAPALDQPGSDDTDDRTERQIGVKVDSDPPRYMPK